MIDLRKDERRRRTALSRCTLRVGHYGTHLHDTAFDGGCRAPILCIGCGQPVGALAPAVHWHLWCFRKSTGVE